MVATQRFQVVKWIRPSCGSSGRARESPRLVGRERGLVRNERRDGDVVLAQATAVPRASSRGGASRRLRRRRREAAGSRRCAPAARGRRHETAPELCRLRGSSEGPATARPREGHPLQRSRARPRAKGRAPETARGARPLTLASLCDGAVNASATGEASSGSGLARAARPWHCRGAACGTPRLILGGAWLHRRSRPDLALELLIPRPHWTSAFRQSSTSLGARRASRR